MVKLSILVASKNQAKYIPDMLSALASQTFQDYELIVVDSFSTDNSIKLFKSFKKSKIFLKDCSAEEAHIFGLQQANGKYIMLATTSDYLYSSKWLEKAITTLELYKEISLVWGSAVNINDQGVVRGIWGSHYLYNHPPNKFNYLQYWFFNPYLPELNFIVRKDVYKLCLNSRDSLGYMYKFLFNFTKQGFLPFYIPELAHAGRSHPNNLTTKNRLYDFIQYNWILKRKQFMYLLQIFFGVKSHLFVDSNFKNIANLSLLNRFCLPFAIAKIYLFESPKAFFRKINRLFFLKLD
jgi:glycosyltransferase involved in cell wall biosynthesis